MTADPPEATTSSVAAAVWYPTGIPDRPDVLGWASRTFDEFTRQAAAGGPGVVMRPTRMLLRAEPSSEEWWTTAVPLLCRIPAHELPAPYAAGREFTVPTVEMPRYLPWLRRQFTEGGGTLVRQRLGRLDEATGWAPVVVNAPPRRRARENAAAPDSTEAEPGAAPLVGEEVPDSRSVGPVGLEPTTNGLKVHCSAN